VKVATKKRLLLLNLARDYGGVEHYVESLVTLLKDDIEFFAVMAGPHSADRLERLGVRVFRVPECHNRILRYFAGGLLAAWVILRQRVHKVHENAYGESIVLPFLSLLGARRYQTCHHLPPTTPAAFLYSRIFASMDKLCCVSKTTEEGLRRLVGRSVKIFTILNWVDLPVHAIQRKNPSQGSMRVLFVGRLQEYKGAQLLIEAVRGMNSVELTIVGRGPYGEELHKLADGLPNVHLSGFVTEEKLESVYSNTDLLVNPSMGPEGSSIVALNALARNVPCLMSDIPTFRELVEESQAAALFRSGDVEDLRAKLVELRDNPGLREALVSRGIQLVRDKHSSMTAREQYRIFFDI
jgi:glycosyltransferase involved in cell wall biosynthesis